MPSSTLDAARRVVAGAELDVLVFCEVGMNTMTYFLSFSRLARRSVLFWGHAVTSGVAAVDGLEYAPEGGVADDVGGLDYFVSSELFEPKDPGARGGQDDYSERLWLMRGLTTRFPEVVAPRESLRVRDVIPNAEGKRLYLVPQTLYKLHPDFDEIITAVLRADAAAVVAMPEAQLGEWTDALATRWESTVGADVRDRVVFFRRLDFDEFVRLAQLADVVLDPFPVGGGRSSLEIFSVGTPIVVLEPRTSVLQLTRGMYELMGDPCPECVCQTVSDYVASAVTVATTTSPKIRRRILERNSVLYENDAVTREWEDFLEYAVAAPRPVGEWHRALYAREELATFERPPSPRGGAEPEGGGAEPETKRGYARRESFGWEWADLGPGDDGNNVDLGDPSLAYAVRLNHPDPWTGVTASFVVVVRRGEDPADVADAFARHIGAEPVKRRWLAAVLQNGARRDAARLVDQHVFDLGDGRREAIAVKYGDDLHQLATWRGLQIGLDDGAIQQVAAELERRTPNHAAADWLRARFERDAFAASERRGPSGDAAVCFGGHGALGGDHRAWRSFGHEAWSSATPRSPSRRGGDSGQGVPTDSGAGGGGPALAGAPPSSSLGEPCSVTVGLTTCKRLQHFQATMRSLSRALGVSSPATHPSVCRVVVVDDASSESDKVAMQREFPDLDFVFKSPKHKGHAKSMNLLLRLVETRYLLYMEDDWLALEHVRAADVLDDALAVLRDGAPDAVVQVLLNDQASRACAYASDAGCDHLGEAGWPRTTRDGVAYNLHDFGTVDPDHAFTYWPGFTLNPALWDVQALTCAFQNVRGHAPSFDVDDARFEQAFSVQAYDAGLRVAYLPRVSFAHIGVDESAYGLNNYSRPWDGQVGGGLR